MPQTSWKTAGTVVTIDETGDATNVWSNPTNAQGAADTTVATQSYVSSFPIGTPNYLKCTNFGFTSIDIPTGSTIVGIEFRFTKMSSTTTAYDLSCQTYKGGVKGGSDYADMILPWATTLTQTTYGSIIDLWGRTWADSDITASNFGVGLVSYKSGKGSLTNSVDCVECRITYLAPITFNLRKSSSFITFLSILRGL